MYSFVVTVQTRVLGNAHWDLRVLGGVVNTAVVGVRARFVVTGVVNCGTVVVYKDLKIGKLGVVDGVIGFCRARRDFLCAELKRVQDAGVVHSVLQGALNESSLARLVFVHHPGVQFQRCFVSLDLVPQCPSDDFPRDAPEVGFSLAGHQLCPGFVQPQNLLRLAVGISLLRFGHRHCVVRFLLR